MTRVPVDARPRAFRAAWLAEFERLDVPAVRANEVAELLHDPHLEATGFFRAIDQRDGRFLHMASPAQWKGWSPDAPQPAPTLAEDTRGILREAGYDDGRIDALAAAGVTRAGAA